MPAVLLQAESGASQQKRYLASLKNTDPEFFKFLKENDEELLHFDETSDDDDEQDEESVHQPPESLEVASDDSDYEEEADDGDVASSKKRSIKASFHSSRSCSFSSLILKRLPTGTIY